MSEPVKLDYTVRLEVFTEGDMHVRAFKTNFDIRNPEEKWALLSRIAAHLANEIWHEMFPVYRPSPIEVLEAEWYKAKMEREME